MKFDAALALFAALFVWSVGAEAGRRPFTVVDAIETGKIVPFPGSDGAGLFSPDGTRFLVWTRRGNVAENANVESLLLFKSADVSEYLNGAGAVPQARLLVRKTLRYLKDPDAWAKFLDVRWVDDRHVTFLAQGNNGSNQVLRVDVDDGMMTELTSSSTDIVSYDIHRDTVVYWAVADTQEDLVVPVMDRSLWDVVRPGVNSNFPLLDLYQTSRASGLTKRIQAPTIRLNGSSTKIWLAPDAKHAIILMPSAGAPAHWSEYRIQTDIRLADSYAYLPAFSTQDPRSAALRDRTRFQLVELDTNSTRPLLDAPSGVGAYAGLGAPVRTPMEVFWVTPDRAVVVNTFLPLKIADARVVELRRNSPAATEINVDSGSIVPIVWTRQKSATGMAEQITAIEWDGDRRMLRAAWTSSAGKTVYRQYQRARKGGWHTTPAVPDRQSMDFQLYKTEGLNQPPVIRAAGDACRCSKLFFDPAPELAEFSFGHGEAIEWKDANGLLWHGGLFVPPGYRPGQRYPLVVQTHGFDPNEFLIDGPYGYTTATAAQPLLNRGIGILQVHMETAAMTLDEREAAMTAEGFRKGIETVVNKGVADSGKVGLIAFSRTGLPAIRLLIDQPQLLRAATIADAAWFGYVPDVLMHNLSSQAQNRKLTGGSPSEVGVPRWIESNPLYRLPETRAAVRIEANGSGIVLPFIGMWEHYVVLHSHQRPVDMIYFPRASHVLVKPAERLASQGGNVDWFDYWLNDHEDPNPEKEPQYRRWRELKRLR